MKTKTNKTALIPKLRFPEFKDSGAWEVKRLGEVFTFISTKSYSRDQLNYENGIIKNIHYGDIHTKFKSLFDVTKESVPFLNSEVIQKSKINDEQYCREGDLIFADASEDLNDIGKCIEIINTNDEKIVAGLHTLHARQKEKFLTLKFGAYLFQSSLTRGQIQRESQGAKVLGISASRMKKIMLIIPPLPEQQKIADFLSNLDEWLAAEEEKLTLLETYKKGLLQNLFPAEGETVPTPPLPRVPK
ncbi:MAG: hypothetical protein KatS3mg031_3141 [Chitinophagales bacterium]|nr:MAG: hypothetical protein KatS3mg031_3141 [Chitinophagales bacterium]